jgi:hypothetical protein
MHHVTQHLQVWIAVGTAKVVSLSLTEAHEIAGIFALLCGAVASLAIAWWHIFKKPKGGE